jgi:hypothetical protein
MLGGEVGDGSPVGTVGLGGDLIAGAVRDVRSFRDEWTLRHPLDDVGERRQLTEAPAITVP